MRDAAGTVVDFRDLVDRLRLGPRLDPGDPHAARGSWGGVVTADGAEAEVVTPPVAVVPGAPAEVAAWARRGREFLAGALPAGAALAGYSTHISVAVPDQQVRTTARLVVERFAPALMLLVDRPSSPGLLVRPRPGRLEICGEHLEGRALRHAVAVVLAVAAVCQDLPDSELPPRLRVRTQPSRQRFGTYVDRTAFGPDLYAEGRAARLRTRRGRTTAGAHLAAVVELLGGRLAGLLDAEDLAALHAVAAGDLPLPLEDPAPQDDCRDVPVRPLRLGSHRSGGVVAETVSATWWTYVVRVDGPAGTRWLTLPREWAGDFFAQLHAGRLDDVLATLTAPAASPPRSRGQA